MAGVFVGGATIIDALTIFAGYQTAFNQVFSMMEIVWFFLSSMEFYCEKKENTLSTSALSYLIYFVLSWSFGSYWLMNNGNLIELPYWFITFALIFGGYYMINNLVNYRKIVTKD